MQLGCRFASTYAYLAEGAAIVAELYLYFLLCILPKVLNEVKIYFGFEKNYLLWKYEARFIWNVLGRFQWSFWWMLMNGIWWLSAFIGCTVALDGRAGAVELTSQNNGVTGPDLLFWLAWFWSVVDGAGWHCDVIIIIIHEIYIVPLSILIKCSRRFKILGTHYIMTKNRYIYIRKKMQKWKKERMNVCLQNAKLNKWDLRLLLKDVEESEFFSSGGSEFHRAGPAWAKARSPQDFFESGMCRRPELEDRRVRVGW